MKNIFFESNISTLIIKCLLVSFLCTNSGTILAQEKLTQDTIECPIVGFTVGTMFPGANGSQVTMPDGTTSKMGTMQSLYKAPWLDFGVNVIYKKKSNLLLGLEGSFCFGSNNLKDRELRLPSIFTHDNSTPFVIGTNGTDANVTCYNRGLNLKASVSQIFKVIPNNPNSGILGKLAIGLMQQQTIFEPHESEAPQLAGDYGRLYDHQRFGWTLTEGIGFWFMSNKLNLVNTYIAFEITECWSHSTRDYTYDNLLNMANKDENKYFDLLYSIKLCWMFPLKGKTTYDYYYY